MKYSEDDLQEALRALESTVSKCEKALPKLKENTSQHTLLVRRIKAFQISISLVEKALAEYK